MNRFFERALVISALASAPLCAVACGGSFQGDEDEGGAGSGGSAGSAGKAGHAGAAGSSVAGSSSAGTSAGGTNPGGTCEYNGVIHREGDSFPAGDGCNSCYCGSDGFVACTAAFCDQCSDVESVYAAAVEEAKTCDPAQPDACSELVFVGLQCGCESFLNPANADAIERATAAQQQFGALACGGDVLCGECLAPTSATCSPEGKCVDIFEGPVSGTACLVEGQVYESGTSGVPDPFSCNTCDCVEGELTNCTEIGCADACPPDTVQSTQCASCGPVDNCTIVEHACLPVCTDTCATGACIEGVCRMVCG